MGGNAHAWDEQAVPLMRSERLLLEKAVEQDVPVLGVCLGAQVLTRALGGTVKTAPQPERGWIEIMPTEAAADDPLFGHLEEPTGVYQWHDDVFEPPPGARVLAKRTESESGFPGRRRGRLGHPVPSRGHAGAVGALDRAASG